MGKSKKLKLGLETENELRPDESSIEKNKSQKIKHKKKNKTPIPSDETEINQKFASHDETGPTEKKKKTKSSEKNTESEMKKKTAVEDVAAETGSVNKKKSKKRKSELIDESTSPSLPEATDSTVETKKKKRKHLTDEDEGNAEEPESGSKAKKSKLKNAGVSNDTKVTDSEPKQKSEKKSKNKPKTNETTPGNEDGRNSCTIFIGNVPMKYNKKALGKLLKEKGKLLKFWTRGFIPKSDKIPKKTAAIANLLTDEHPPVVVYALFATAADAKNALTLNGAIFEDHRLRVTPANAKKSPSELGVFVGNLPQNITDDELYDFFSQCGKIVSTRVVRNNMGRGRGVAFVNFEATDSVELALKLNEEKLNGREIRVTRVKNKRQLDKMQKRKSLGATNTKDALFNKKHKTKKPELSSNKPSKFQKKLQKKKLTSVEVKKKILAEKLTNKTKRKEKKSE